MKDMIYLVFRTHVIVQYLMRMPRNEDDPCPGAMWGSCVLPRSAGVAGLGGSWEVSSPCVANFRVSLVSHNQAFSQC